MRTRTFLPRPEYPRPDRQRAFVHGSDWLNLNGAWDFRFDPDGAGEQRGWHLPGEESWPEQIIVPFCWESLGAWGEADAAGNENFYSTRVYRNPLEVTRFNYRSASRYEVGWYRRAVCIPQNEHWRDRRVILTVGAADFFTRAWCDGVELGTHEGGYTPFEFDLTQALRPNESGQLTGTIVFRVEDPMRNYEQPVGKQWGWYSSASGIWQTVWLEPRAPVFIQHFEITTDIGSGEARFHVLTNGGGELRLQVTSPRGEWFEEIVRVVRGKAEATVALGTPALWDPNAPQLYDARLTLHDAADADVVHTYFGMRSLSAVSAPGDNAPGCLALNGEPIYLRGALYQSYHAEGVYTAGDVEAIQDDILAAKRAGFDLLRVHIKVDDPLLLYYADKLGIMLMCDFPNFGEGGDTAIGRRRYEEMMRATIARDFNHPSIVAWCLFNETWGFGGQTEFVKLINPAPPLSGDSDPVVAGDTKLSSESAYEWVGAMWELAKKLDPTRLVEDMSVVAWQHLQYYGHGNTDVNSWHFYSSDYGHSRRQIAETVANTFTGSTHNYLPGFAQAAQPLINSEYGGVGALDGDVDTSWSFKFLTNELRRHPQLSAYIYTELHDVEWERNGFLNYDRTAKEFGYDPTIVNQGDVLPIDAPPIQLCAPRQELEIDIYSSHFSRRKREAVTLHWRMSGVDSLGWIHDAIDAGEEPIAFPHLHVALAKRLRIRMPDRTMLATFWARAFAPDGTLVARNFIQFYVNAGSPGRQDIGRSTVLRLQPHEWHAAEWTSDLTSRESALACGACSGKGRGFFEWRFPITPQRLQAASRLNLLVEASSCREGTPQTDSFAQPTALRITLNGVAVYRAVLPNHPHDSRGALSYLSGGKGAYGYLCHATIEGALLDEVRAAMKGQRVRLRCAVPRDEQPHGGLTIYGSASGRYPLPPTLIIE